MAELFTRRTLIAALSGSSASMLAMGLLFPLERVRLLKQIEGSKGSVLDVLFRIHAEGGLGGLFQGVRPSLTALGASNFVYHYCLTFLREATTQWFAARAGKRRRPRLESRAASSPLVGLVLAAIAGALNVLVATPLWVACIRLSVRHKQQLQLKQGRGAAAEAGGAAAAAAEDDAGTGLVSMMRLIAREEGVGALWSGLLPSLILVSNPSIQFVAYEQFRHVLQAYRGKLGSGSYFFLGAAAKLVATLLTYPLQVAKARLQVVKQRRVGDSETASSEADEEALQEARWGTIGCLLGIWRREGLGGLFFGMNAKLTQTVLTSAFMFTFFEKIQANLEDASEAVFPEAGATTFSG